MRINMSIDDSDVRRRLDRLARKGADLRPLMKSWSEIMLSEVEKNFAAGGRPAAWKASARSRRDGGKPLTDRARLRRSMTARSDERSARVGTNVIYGPIQHLGGKTRPHVIRARHARALSWPGARHPVRSVNHPGSKIPARPFLVIPDDGRDRIKQAAIDFLEVKQ
jgi:phage virion morphogenesis protein